MTQARMAMCNTGEDGHVYVITSYYTGEMAMCNTGKYGHVYVTTSYDTGYVGLPAGELVHP